MSKFSFILGFLFLLLIQNFAIAKTHSPTHEKIRVTLNNFAPEAYLIEKNQIDGMTIYSLNYEKQGQVMRTNLISEKIFARFKIEIVNFKNLYTFNKETIGSIKRLPSSNCNHPVSFEFLQSPSSTPKTSYYCIDQSKQSQIDFLLLYKKLQKFSKL